jgi:flagellar basal body-associated protein FliL
MADKDEDKKQIGIKDKLMLYITLGVLGFVALVIGGEYLVIMYSQSKTDEVVEAQPEVIALVQNALVGLIGITSVPKQQREMNNNG